MNHESSKLLTLYKYTKLTALRAEGHSFFKNHVNALESGINVPLRLLIFLIFLQGLRPYSGLHRAYLSGISVR